MSGRSWAIPDIHGCAATLRALLDRLDPGDGDSVYLLGDLIDRGPDSKRVLDEVIRLGMNGVNVIALRGNHEEMLLNACRDRDSFRLWMLNGGGATLDSFRVEDACEIPIRYRELLNSFPLYAVTERFVLVHAGIDCSLADPVANREALLWSRSDELCPEALGGRRLVAGHTPKRREEIVASLKAGKIILDNGCVYRCGTGFGTLAALDLDTLELVFQENVEKEETARRGDATWR